MADLRIVDAPVLLQESITDDVKMPTGGLGNFSVRLGDILWYAITKEQLANKSYVDLSSKGVKDSLDVHIADKANPHQVTKEQVGLGNVDNTADIDKPVSNATKSAIITATMDMATKAYVNSKDGDLTTLTTTDKASLVKAINEVVSVKANKADVASSVSNLTNDKANKATTLVGYGISDAYTKSEIDTNYGGVKTLYDKNVVAGAGANGWDANLVTYGEITQKQINDGLDSIAQLLSIKNPRDGMRAYVKSYHAGLNKGGGEFIYDSTKATINNCGTVINGWVRRKNNIYITPCMFGAHADDKTDDTPYIQKAIDFATANGKTLDYEGRDYVVKKESYTNDVLQSFLTITGGVEMIGNGAKFRIDQSNAPQANKVMALFRPMRPATDATNYTKSIGKISISGFEFNGGFDYATATDSTTINDVKKCFFLYSFEVIFDELNIKRNTFKKFAQQNVIAVGFSSSFKSYGIAKKSQIIGNYFYDNGLKADMSTLYLMSTDNKVFGNTFEQPKGREDLVLCAMELHGSNSVVFGNHFINQTSWVNLATNPIESIVGNYIVTGNTGEAIENLGRIWSGESADDADLSDIVVTGNNVTFIDSDKYDVTNRNRALVGTGGFNKTLKSLVVSGNTVRVQTLTDVKPVYMVDLAVQYDWVSDIGNIVISGNTGFDVTGFASIGRYLTQAIDNCLIRNINIYGNNIFNTANAYIKPVTINQIDDPTVSVRNLSVGGNVVSSTHNKLYWFVRTEGNIDNFESYSNIFNNKPVSDAFLFVKKPQRISTNQSRNPSEYGDLDLNKNPKIHSCKTEYLTFEFPTSLININNLNGEIALGVIYSGSRIKRAHIRLPIGQSAGSGDSMKAYLHQSGADGSGRMTDSIEMLNRPAPTARLTVGQDYSLPLAENKYVKIILEASHIAFLNNLKSARGNILIEVEIEKLI